MNNINFHSLKSVAVPEELKESVIAIPERSGKKRSAYPVHRIRFAAAAAILAVITAVSVALFLNSGKPPVTVKPPATESQVTPTVLTVESTQLPTTVSGESTQPSATVDRPSEASSSARQPSSEPSNASNPEPTQAPARSEAPARPEAPTQPQMSAPTQASTQQPTISASDPPTEIPTDKPIDLAAIGYDGIIIEEISADELSGDSLIFCRIYTADGEPLGDSDPYSDDHLARRIDLDSAVTVYYIPIDYIALPYKGMYRYEFYDETGRILCAGSEYLMPESIN